MNKKSMAKIGAISVFSVLVLCAILFLLLPFLSSANENVYVLGERVRVDLGDYSGKVRVETPSTSLVYDSAKVFLFVPEEEGKYRITYGEEVFEFEAVGNSHTTEEGISEQVSLENFEEKNSSGNGSELLDLGGDKIDNFGEDQIVVGERVKKTEKLIVEGYEEEAKVKIPDSGEDIFVSDVSGERDFEVRRNFVETLKGVFTDDVEKEIVVEGVGGEISVEYYLPAPQKTEEEISENKKEVTISAPDYLGYENVLAFTDLDNSLRLSEGDKIKIYWGEEERYLDFEVFDNDGDGYIDRVEWIVPHLSTQTFLLTIEISSAIHLDDERNFLEDVYSEVGALDKIYKEISEGDYLRVSFEDNLTSENDITIYARGDVGSRVEVYEKDSDVKLAEFSDLDFDGRYYVLLNNLVGENNVFDLKVVGGSVYFDYVVDPTEVNDPSAYIDDGAKWDTETGAYSDGGESASTTNAGKTIQYYGYGFSYVQGYTIQSVRVRTDYSVEDTNDYFLLQVSWDGGTTWSSVYTLPNFQSETTVWTNVTNATSWTYDELNDTNFRVRYNPQSVQAGSTWYVDYAPVEVIATYSPPPGELNVLLNFPDEEDYVNSEDVHFNFSTSSNYDFVNCSLWDNSTTSWHLNQSNSTEIINGTYNFINKTYDSDGIYLYNIQCCDTTNCTFAITNHTFIIDTIKPLVSLISPEEDNFTDSVYGVDFTYNVSDANGIESCSLVVDGEKVVVDSSVERDTAEIFEYFLENGVHNWSVNCTDLAGNENASEMRTINVSVTPISWQRRFYETSSSNYTSTAYINLANSRDSSENYVAVDVPAGGLYTIVDATSPFIGGDGAYLTSGTVSFSGVLSSSSANKGYLTWKVYITNSTGDYLICQAGDDSANDPPSTQITSASTTTYTSSCTNPSDLSLSPTDRIRLVMNIRNSHSQAVAFTHYWDYLRLSYVEFADFYTLGTLFTDLTYPTGNLGVTTGEDFNVTCAVNCSGGRCINTDVYVQYNTSVDGWQDVGSSGNLVLGSGESNSHNLGNVNSTTQYTNFTITGNSASINNIRCVGVSDNSEYNGTTTRQITVGSADLAPDVNLTSPEGGRWFNESAVDLFYNVSDDGNSITNCSLYVNGTFNQTNQTPVINGAENNFSLVLEDNFYNWTVYCYDAASQGGTDTVRTFYVDTGFPYLDLIYPGKDDVVYESSVNFNFTISDNLDGVPDCNLYVDGIPRGSPFTAVNGEYTNRTVSGLSISDHLWNLTCWDGANNYNSSVTWNFSIIDLSPTVNLTNPEDNHWSNTSNVDFFYNASDNNDLANCSLYLNGVFNQTNQTPVVDGAENNFSVLGLVDGEYDWTVRCFDDGGLNTTPSNRTLYVDTYFPHVDLGLPGDLDNYNFSDVYFNFTATDNMDDPMSCNLTINGVVVGPSGFSADNGSITNRLVQDLDDGANYWNVTCWDEANNANTSATRMLNVTDYPSVYLNLSEGKSFNYSDIALLYTPSDNMDFSSCSLYINGVFNQTNQTEVVNGALNNFTLTFDVGNYNWSVLCEDTYGLKNQTGNKSFTVDLAYPQIDLFYPGKGDTVYNAVVTFNYSVVDDLSLFSNCSLTVNSEVLNWTLAQNGSYAPVPITFADGGLKYWNVSCSDGAGNLNTSETRNFTLYLPPRVNLTNPEDDFWFNTTSRIFYYNVSDGNNDIANASFILNGVFNQSNQTPVLNNELNNFTIVGLSEGDYTWNVNVSDSEGLIGNDAPRTFHVDLQVPSLKLIYPLEGNVSASNNITLNFTVSDNLDNPLMCNVSFYETGQDAYNLYENIDADNSSYEINYVLRGDGNYTWNVTCIDEAGNFNSSDVVNFSVVAPPNVVLNSPPDGNLTANSDITFYYTPYDPFGILQCQPYFDGAAYGAPDINIEHNEQNSFTVTGIAEGEHNWTVNCIDADYNADQPTEWHLIRDNTAPNISLDSPGNESGVYYGNGIVILYWTATDLWDEQLRCDLYVDGAIDTPNKLVSSGKQTSEQVSLSEGWHNWSATCRDRVGNSNDSVVYYFNFTYPDFVINSSLISINDSTPREGDNVSVNVTVYNDGGADIPWVIVRLYDGDPGSGGSQINGDSNISVGKFSSNVSQFYWSADIGQSNIYAIVDPPLATNGSYDEWDETNNENSTSASAGAWHYFYGDIETYSNYTLEDSSDYRVIVWNVNNFNDGNIYVADSDSVISWSNLFGLGRNETGGVSSNDFSEADALLNLTGFDDSIYSLYTTGGTPDNVSSYTVFKNSITNVPEYESINNTNFLTGILWDGTLDTNGEFDSGEKEDLVFVSKINKSSQGAYGIYDYEFRVPSPLKRYRGGTDAVVFYVELR